MNNTGPAILVVGLLWLWKAYGIPDWVLLLGVLVAIFSWLHPALTHQAEEISNLQIHKLKLEIAKLEEEAWRKKE